MSSCRVLACAASLLTALASAATPPATLEFDAALEAYERNHWPDAYGAMARLADGGNAEAARVALQMKRYGPALYGQRFEATAQQEQRWVALLPSAADELVLPRRAAVAPSGR